MLKKYCDYRAMELGIYDPSGEESRVQERDDNGESEWQKVRTWDLSCPWEGEDGYCSCCEGKGAEMEEPWKGMQKKRTQGAEFERKLRQYKSTHGCGGKIGGRSYDITKMSRFEKVQYEYDNEMDESDDPDAIFFF
ncbi:hypothetical protein BDZ91DRAFT_853405 [Kalaharituber pfeilii]|nr:hypothetical protein BDZ91DRAFT_853405 [Kalaharituber pfeilii]